MKKIPFDQNDLKDLNPEQTEQYKSEYGDIFMISVEDKKCYLHKPNRSVLDLASRSSSKRNSKFNETILKNCWIAGDKEIVTNDEYFLGASTQLDEVIKFKDAEIKKL